MKRWFPTLLVFAVCSAVVHADVTVVQTMTVEGGMAAMSGQSITPKTTIHIKGLKSRTDVDASMIQISTITDLIAKQVILLRPDQKTAQIITKADAPAAPAAQPPAASAVDAALTPTGRTQTIDGLKCDEFSFTSLIDTFDMAAGGQMPPEAAEVMKDMKMKIQGTIWVAKDAPGASEYLAFQKAVAASDLSSSIARASGMSMPGMEKMMKAVGAAPGMPYLTEMNINVEGTGQLAQMMQQAGPMKITVRVSSVTTDPIADDLFKTPEGYTVIKQ